MSPHYRAISIFTCTRALCYNRPALTGSMASTLGASLAQSRLDYANYIMYGMSASNMHELRFAQNALAREVLPSFRHLSASEWHSYLHWLSVHYRIQFKMATLTYTTVATCHPSYLWIISSKYTSHHELSVLQPKNFSRFFFFLSTDFSYSSPATWNSIQSCVCVCVCVCVVCDEGTGATAMSLCKSLEGVINGAASLRGRTTLVWSLGPTCAWVDHCELNLPESEMSSLWCMSYSMLCAL